MILALSFFSLTNRKIASHQLFLRTIFTFSTLFVVLFFGACKKSSEETTASNEPEQTTHKVTKRLTPSERAEKMIDESPNLTLVSKKSGEFTIKNKYSEVELTLTPEEIIAEKHKLLSLIGPEHVKNLNNKPKPSWGKAPQWVYRYPGAEILSGSHHTPMDDGSVIGSIALLHSDSIATAAMKLIEHYQALDMKLNVDGTRQDTRILSLIGELDDAGKSQVTLTLSKQAEKTRVSTQYSYGMP